MKYDFVPASETDAILETELGASLARKGFLIRSPRAYVRSRIPEIRDLIIIQPMKGASYAPCWGFSLDFVPHISRDALRWHRTDRSARLDLRFDPLDYLHPGSSEFRQWTIDSARGAKNARKDIRRITTLVSKHAEGFFARVQSESDLLRSFEREATRKAVRFNFYNYSQQPIAYAFILARIGKLDSAKAELEKAYAMHDASVTVRQRLKEMIGQFAADPQGRPDA